MFAVPKKLNTRRREISIHANQPAGPGAGRYTGVGERPKVIGGVISKITHTPRTLQAIEQGSPGQRSASSCSSRRGRSLTRDTSVTFPGSPSPGPAAYSPREVRSAERTTSGITISKGGDRDYSSYLITPGGGVVKRIRGSTGRAGGYISHRDLDTPTHNAYAVMQTQQRLNYTTPSRSRSRGGHGHPRQGQRSGHSSTTMLGPPRSQCKADRQKETSRMLLNTTTSKAQVGVDPKQLTSFQVKHPHAAFPGTTRGRGNPRRQSDGVMATPAPGPAGELSSAFDKAAVQKKGINTFGAQKGAAWVRISESPGVGAYTPRDNYEIKGGVMKTIKNRSIKPKDNKPTPSPGQYEVPSSFDRAKVVKSVPKPTVPRRSSSQRAMQRGRNIHYDPETPGPAAYSPVEVSKTRSSSVRLSASSGRDYITGELNSSGMFIRKPVLTKAGPGDYTPESSFTVKSFNTHAMAQARQKNLSVQRGSPSRPRSRTPKARSIGTPERLFSTPTASSFSKRAATREADIEFC